MIKLGSIILIFALTAFGCQQAYWAAGADHLPYPDLSVRHPSLVLPAPALLEKQLPGEPSPTPWYAYRNDLVRSTPAGYQAPAFEYQWTFVVDRQSISNRRVWEYFSSTTYRRRFTFHHD